MNDNISIYSFPCGATYDLSKETLIHAHPIKNRYPNDVPTFVVLRKRSGGESDDLFSVIKTFEFHPYNTEELNKYIDDEYYNNLKSYIDRRRAMKFGFESADKGYAYRFYALSSVFSFVPAYKPKRPNDRQTWYLSLSDLGLNAEMMLSNTDVSKSDRSRNSAQNGYEETVSRYFNQIEVQDFDVLFDRFAEYIKDIDNNYYDSIDFHDKSRYLGKEEFYKTELGPKCKALLAADSWSENEIGSGQILDRVFKVLDLSTNLVDHRFALPNFKR